MLCVSLSPLTPLLHRVTLYLIFIIFFPINLTSLLAPVPSPLPTQKLCGGRWGIAQPPAVCAFLYRYWCTTEQGRNVRLPLELLSTASADRARFTQGQIPGSCNSHFSRHCSFHWHLPGQEICCFYKNVLALLLLLSASLPALMGLTSDASLCGIRQRKFCSWV